MMPHPLASCAITGSLPHRVRAVSDRLKKAGVKDLWRLLAHCIALCLLVGCEPQGREAQYKRYLARLGHTLSVDIPVIQPPTLPGPPGTDQLHLDIPASSLDSLDFLTLSGCAVQVTIGKRSSSLGRLARDSQRLLLALEYLRLAPRCITYQRDQDATALSDTLEQAWQLQWRQLPALIFNATLGGTEYRALWYTPAYASEENYPGASSSQVIFALQAINGHARRWLSGDYRADNRAFEILLSEVAAGDGGTLLQALASQDAWLAGANAVLAKRLVRGPLCTPRIRPAAANILPGVVRKYFIGEIQPGTASLDQRYHELLPPVVALEKLLSLVLPLDYRDWESERNVRLAKLLAAPDRHVQQLKAVQQPCIDI